MIEPTEQQQIDAMLAYAAQVAERNQAAMRDVDKMFEKRGTNGSGVERKDKLTASQRAARDRDTLHDYLAKNPALAAQFRKRGFEALGLR